MIVHLFWINVMMVSNLFISSTLSSFNSPHKHIMLIQGGQHGLPSVWLRLELCDNQDFNEDVDDGDNHNYETEQKGHSNDHEYDNNNDYNAQNHHHHHMTNTFEDAGDQQEQESLEKIGKVCSSPRLLMITKLPDFYTTLSNKVGVKNFIRITVMLIVLRCGLVAESGGSAALTGLLLVLRF